jgi:membrane fusion protein (multidrug efflux system)
LGLLAALSLNVGVAACAHGSAAKPAGVPAGPPVPVVAGTVSAHTVNIYTDYVARTAGLQTIEIRPRVAGFLNKVNFVAGGLVRKGQLLFEIQPEEYQAALLTARAQRQKAEADLQQQLDKVAVDRAAAALAQQRAERAKAQRDVERYRPLAAAQAVPQTDLDSALTREQVAEAGVQAAEATLRDSQLSQRVGISQARAAVDQAKASVINAELNLSYASIRSPITGVAGFVKVDPGNYVTPAQTPVMTTISTIDPMKVAFGLSESDYLRVVKQYQWDAHLQLPVLTLTLANGELYPQKGTPTHVDRALDPKTGMIGVEATFPNPQGLLRPGQFAKIGFSIEERKNALLIPARSVIKLQGLDVVYVIGPENKVEQRTVTLGARVQNDVVVLSGLKSGEKIVVDGIQKVQPGGTVVPQAPVTK